MSCDPFVDASKKPSAVIVTHSPSAVAIMVASSVPVSAFQIAIEPFWSPEKTRVPSDENATLVVDGIAASGRKLRKRAPVVAFHNLVVFPSSVAASSIPVRTRLPSGENATTTSPTRLWSERVSKRLPVLTSQMAAPSLLRPAIIRRPSGEKATEEIHDEPWVPIGNSRIDLPVLTSDRLAPRSPPTSKRSPFGREGDGAGIGIPRDTRRPSDLAGFTAPQCGNIASNGHD